MNNIELFMKEKLLRMRCVLQHMPENAIKMTEDQDGFIYPQIDRNKCVQCGLCKTVCNYQKTHEAFKPIAGYVATNTNHDQLMKSSSGAHSAHLRQKYFRMAELYTVRHMR